MGDLTHTEMAQKPGIVEKKDRFGRVDFFDANGKSVVDWKVVEDWENTPYANKWSLQEDSIPQGIAYQTDENGDKVLVEKEWKRMMKMYADNGAGTNEGFRAAMERHCMYFKSEKQIEFRSNYGLYHGFSKITWRRGKAVHNYTINTADHESDPPFNTLDVIKR